jgi:hypothetical protein
MGIRGELWAAWGARLRSYTAGETPDLLVPVAGGDGVPFVHDKVERTAEATDGGLVTEGLLTVFTAVRMPIGTVYTYSGRTWQVATQEHDRAAGSDWPHKHELVQHAR